MECVDDSRFESKDCSGQNKDDRVFQYFISDRKEILVIVTLYLPRLGKNVFKTGTR